MTDRRATITLNWRPAGQPARRVDDFAEVPYTPRLVTRATDNLPKQPCRQSDIAARLENWAKWAKSGEGPTAAACMTGAICETLRKAVEGIRPSESADMRSIDSNDAVLIGRAMVRLTLDQRRLLGLYYVDGERKGFIAAMMRFPVGRFDHKLVQAQDELEEIAARLYQNSNSK